MFLGIDRPIGAGLSSNVKAGMVFRSLKLILRQQGRLVPELFRYATEGAMP
jgi:hypothetical protein